jgi:hypothetical protein
LNVRDPDVEEAVYPIWVGWRLERDGRLVVGRASSDDLARTVGTDGLLRPILGYLVSSELLIEFDKLVFLPLIGLVALPMSGALFAIVGMRIYGPRRGRHTFQERE